MNKLLLIALFYPCLSIANSWYVSLPTSHISNGMFYYTSVLYITEEGLKSKEPLNLGCSKDKTCWIGVNTQNSANPNDMRGLDSEQYNVSFRGDTVGDALTALYSKVGTLPYTSSGSAPDRTSEGITWCGAIGISTTGRGASYIVMPGGECSKLAPANLECSLQTSNINLDHGTLTSDEVNGNSVSGQFAIDCNKKAQISLVLMNPEGQQSSNPSEGTKITLKENTLFSILTINGKPAVNKTIFDVNNNVTTFTVESTLRKNGIVSPGTFSTFAYIILSYI